MIQRPLNEIERLAVLREYHILDTDPEAAYDEIVELASRICSVPIALVSLVDRDRQWFKARHGIDATETPREIAFCAHAIRQDDVMVVKDAKLDPRFAGNPLVTADPFVRFYAGAPLLTPEGQGLGTLCVVDHEPRHLPTTGLDALRTVARQVVRNLEQRRINAKLVNALERVRLLQDLIPICASCKRTRSDQDYWASLEDYLQEHLGTDFTHGVCPDCFATLYPDRAHLVRRT